MCALCGSVCGVFGSGHFEQLFVILDRTVIVTSGDDATKAVPNQGLKTSNNREVSLTVLESHDKWHSRCSSLPDDFEGPLLT